MPGNTLPQDISTDVVSDVLATPKDAGPNLTLEALILLINSERLKHLHDKTHKEFSELRKRQDQVGSLHNLLKKINNATNESGEFDCSSNPELKEMLQNAKNLGIEVAPDKVKYSKDERDRLVENIRMTVDDLNVMNDMQLQTVNRLINERYESYQLARAILKPLHEAKVQIAKNIQR